MSSSRPSCRRTELMLKTILLWFCPSEDVPSRVHLCFPVLVRSHITSSPLGTHAPDERLKGTTRIRENYKSFVVYS